jgi:hypothetical protein
LFRFEAKNTKLKRSKKFQAKKSGKKPEKMRKIAKKVKKAKIFVSLGSENYSSEVKRKI